MTLLNVALTIIPADNKFRVSKIESKYRFAFRLRNAARVMNNNAQSATDEYSHEMNAYITGAIILAYSSLEAALNEFISLNATDSKSPLNEEKKSIIKIIISEDLRPRGNKNTLQLFNVMLRLIGKPEIIESEKIYQAANLVRKLRNMLVHPRPGTVVTYLEDPSKNLYEQQQIVKQLRNYLALDINATFPNDVLTKKCSKWAVLACEDFLKEFVRLSGIDAGFLT
jgi:hypothetical protein